MPNVSNEQVVERILEKYLHLGGFSFLRITDFLNFIIFKRLNNPIVGLTIVQIDELLFKGNKEHRLNPELLRD